MIPLGIELKGIFIESKEGINDILNFHGEISSIKFKGIGIVKAMLRKEVTIRKIIISEGSFSGRVFADHDVAKPIVLPLKISIGIVISDKINLSYSNTANAASISFKEAGGRLYGLIIEKYDTLSTDIFKQFDFEAEELTSVSADSMYSYKNTGISYSSATNNLKIDSSIIKPGYEDYDFTSRYKFQMNRIEACLSNILIQDLDLAGYIGSGNLKSSYVEVGNMNMKVFRDNRKELRHINRPEFQDMIYSYRGNLKIDTVVLLSGKIAYTVHNSEANEPGNIYFSQISARIYNITNNTIFRKDTAFLIFNANALLMGKSRIAISLNARIYDRKNTFALRGTLAAIEAAELNPILENNAFCYATSGKIDGMSFNFIADNSNAKGKMTMLYQGLDIAVKNKKTDDTTYFRQRFLSMLVNNKVMNSNPLPGKEIREGIIYFERDPERSLPHYCVRALLSGIRSSLQKDPMN